MSSLYSGSSGFMFLNGVKAAKVQNWQFSSSMSTLDTTSLGEVDRTSIAGTRSLSGSCRLYYYDYTSGATQKNDVSFLLNKLIKTDGGLSDPVQFLLGFVGDEGVSKYIDFVAYITNASMVMGVGEVLSADVQFQATGAPTALTM